MQQVNRSINVGASILRRALSNKIFIDPMYVYEIGSYVDIASIA